MQVAEQTARIWCSVSVLCIAAFTMVTSEFAPIGLLSQISVDLGRNPATIGLTVTLYAWIGAASGLLSGWFNSRILPRTLLTNLLLLLAISNGLAAICYDFSTLLGARALGALAHGVFWAIVAATAGRIAPTRQMGLATSIVMGGITIATVMGVPIVNLLGQYFGWRMAFFGLALMSFLNAVLVWVVLPSIAIQSATGRGLLSVLLRRKDLLVVYAITALTAAAHFGGYTFIEPFITKVPYISSYEIAALLFAFGAMGFLGNILSAIFIDRNLMLLISVGLGSMALALFGLGVSGPTANFLWIFILFLLWGVSISTLFTGLQTWVLQIAGDQVISAASVHTAVLNISIGLGVIINSLVLSATSVEVAMLVGGAMVLPAFILIITVNIQATKKATTRVYDG